MLRRHELCSSHKEAVEVTITLPASTGNIAEILSREVMKEKEQNRTMLLKIISSIRFLARQGLPLRGDGKEVLWTPISVQCAVIFSTMCGLFLTIDDERWRKFQKGR